MFGWVVSAAAALILAQPQAVAVDPVLQSGPHPAFPTSGWVRVPDATAWALGWPYGCQQTIGDTSYVRCPDGRWSAS